MTNKLTVKGYSIRDVHCVSVTMLVEDSPRENDIKNLKIEVRSHMRALTSTDRIARWEVEVEPARYDDPEGCFVS